MTLTSNYFYNGPILPGATVVPSELNPFKNIQRLPAMADVADVLTAGRMCYLTGGTNSKMDMTPTVTEHGEAAAEGMVCVVEIITSSPYFATTTDLAVYPNKMPNATCTLTDYTHAANTHMIVIPLLGDMIFWSSSSNDGSFDTTFGTSYIAGAGGIFKAEGQPTGAAPDGRAITATSMATTGNQNWCLLRFEGVRMYDKS